MSLATSTGGGAGLSAGGAGLSVAAMAHDAGANAALSHTHHAHAHHHGSIPGGTSSSSAAPPVSHAALGADLLDRTQSFLSGKGVRNAAKLPIAAVDLYGDKCHVAYFPPVAAAKEGAAGEEENGQTTTTTTKGVLVRTIGGLWANRDDHSADGSRAGGHVVLKREDDASYKAVKKYLSTGSGKGAVLRRSLLEDARDLRSTNAAIVLPRPHLLLGARSEDDLSSAARAALGPLLASRQTSSSSSSSCAIERDPDASLSVVTIALDGGAAPKGDDFDRVAFRMKLSSKKKAATILPEEAVGISIALARKRVEKAYVADVPDSDLARDDPDGDNHDDDEERYGDFPTAFAIPGWAATDPALEALSDAAGGSSSPCGPSLHQRSVAACVGALLPVVGNAGPSRPTPSKLTKLLSDVIRAKAAEAAREAARVAARTRTDPVDPEPHVPLVVLVGATDDGVEVTAVQLSEPQGSEEEVHCPFGDVSVVSSVCGCRGDGMKGAGGGGSDVDVVEEKLEWAMDRLRRQVGFLAPESEEPAAIVTYGTIATQLRVATRLKAILAGYGKEARDDAKRRSQDDDKHEDKDDDDDWDGWDQDIPLLSTHESCTSAGLAVLAASAHSRVKLVVSVKGSDGKHRPKPKPALRIKDVATCAVAVSFNYFGGESSKWTEPKVLFDFDRRVPAGPYRLDFSAAECAAHVRYATSGAAKNRREIRDENVLMTMAKSLEGTRGIPEREDAALNLRFRVLQTTTREEEEEEEGKDRKWIRVGDDMSPLTMEHSQRDEGESGRDHLVACESAVLEISLNPVGLITTGLATNGETIVQATKSARNSKLLKWTGIIGALAFVGGFLVKSFVEERVFERDTQRVLAYYKHAAPNSFHDGDERHARYMVWKYKGKKDALWRRLEAKYGVPVKHAWEWQEEDGMEGDKRETKEAEEEDAEDLDGSEGSEEL